MFTVSCRLVPGSYGYDDYELSIRQLGSRKKFKSAVGPNPDLAVGLLLVMNKEEVSQEGGELRQILDTASVLDVPGLTAVGQGIRNRLEWTKRLLPVSEWSFPERFFEPVRKETYVQRKTTASLVEESLRRAKNGYSKRDLEAIEIRELAKEISSQRRC